MSLTSILFHAARIGYRMLVPVTACLLLILATVPATASAETPFVRLYTDAGEILLVLDSDLAPHHVEHFLYLSRTGFYAGHSFHRIVPGFVIQGGDPNSKDADPGNDGQGGPLLRDVLTAEEFAYFETLNKILAQKGCVTLDDRVNL